MRMDISGYVEQLRGDLSAAAASGSEAIVEAAERLAMALDSAVRISLLEALSDAAAEITQALDGTTVEVRLKGREPQFVVSEPAEPAFAPPEGPAADGGIDDEGGQARITLRLPESLKQRAEEAAERRRQSLNTWLVDAIRAATHDAGERGRPGRHLSGWAR